MHLGRVQGARLHPNGDSVVVLVYDRQHRAQLPVFRDLQLTKSQFRRDRQVDDVFPWEPLDDYLELQQVPRQMDDATFPRFIAWPYKLHS